MELRLLVEQAHAAGLPVTAHAHAAAAVDQAVAVGVEGIEHASYLIRSSQGAPPTSPWQLRSSWLPLDSGSLAWSA